MGCLFWPKKAKPGGEDRKEIDDVQLFSSYDPYKTRKPEVKKPVKKLEKIEKKNEEKVDEDSKEEKEETKNEIKSEKVIEEKSATENGGTQQLQQLDNEN
jgi:hypothetical protein